MELNEKNSAAIISAAKEIIENGQLWVEINGEALYMPEVIEELIERQKNEINNA